MRWCTEGAQCVSLHCSAATHTNAAWEQLGEIEFSQIYFFFKREVSLAL